MRDRTIDGFRALAALGVVVAHAVSYRFVHETFPGMHYLQRIADPLAQTSVQLFFVISGYIITTLLLDEEEKRGRVSISAFYARRVCRIVPPLAGLFGCLLVMRYFGLIALDGPSLVSSATFTCNLGFVDCSWWVAHTWSLSVEEQFYLLWPMMLMLIPNRTALLGGGLVLLLGTLTIVPLAPHSNFISFSCIAVGGLYVLRTYPQGAHQTRARRPLGRGCQRTDAWTALCRGQTNASGHAVLDCLRNLCGP